MSLFLIYDAENYEYILQPAGYAVLVILLLALIVLDRINQTIRRNKRRKKRKSSAQK